MPNNNSMLDKFQGKISKYTDLALKIKEKWPLESVDIVPVIISSTEMIPENLHKFE